MAIRFDKYVWSVRLTKTRSQATDLIGKGKFKLNGRTVKASKEPKLNDVVSLQINSAIFEYKILNLLEKRVGAKLVEEYLIDITKPAELEKHRQYQLAQSTYRNHGTGKPTKKDRRDIDDFLSF
jgi:ribosome-associated heat shock protein Hsp15